MGNCESYRWLIRQKGKHSGNETLAEGVEKSNSLRHVWKGAAGEGLLITNADLHLKII